MSQNQDCMSLQFSLQFSSHKFDFGNRPLFSLWSVCVHVTISRAPDRDRPRPSRAKASQPPWLPAPQGAAVTDSSFHLGITQPLAQNRRQPRNLFRHFCIIRKGGSAPRPRRAPSSPFQPSLRICVCEGSMLTLGTTQVSPPG